MPFVPQPTRDVEGTLVEPPDGVNRDHARLDAVDDRDGWTIAQRFADAEERLAQLQWGSGDLRRRAHEEVHDRSAAVDVGAEKLFADERVQVRQRRGGLHRL